MGSELTYRGHEPQTTSDPYSPKPNKPWLSVIRPIRYILREQRLLFTLLGIFIGALFIILIPTSSNNNNHNIKYHDTYSISEEFSSSSDINGRARGLARARPVLDFSSSGGKIPLGIKRKGLRIVVTGGAGFVGSHLVDRLIARGDSVIVVDNFFTGNKDNVQHHFGNPRFELIRHDVVEPLLLEVDQIYHLACPASPTNVVGTLNMLGLAKRVGARFLLTSTSEVYGDPLQHPQVETYWGNVNPIVSCVSDEERGHHDTLAMVKHLVAEMSNFVSQALRKEPLTVYGDGKQTRSFQFVSDLVCAFDEGEQVGENLSILENPANSTNLETCLRVQPTQEESQISPRLKISRIGAKGAVFRKGVSQ
ncbi:UDP-glucuronic acid decarboxylase 2-like protein [Tanacetum coccineum]